MGLGGASPRAGLGSDERAEAARTAVAVVTAAEVRRLDADICVRSVSLSFVTQNMLRNTNQWLSYLSTRIAVQLQCSLRVNELPCLLRLRRDG